MHEWREGEKKKIGIQTIKTKNVMHFHLTKKSSNKHIVRYLDVQSVGPPIHGSINESRAMHSRAPKR